MEPKHMGKKEFVKLAEAILGDRDEYQDNLIIISRKGSLDLEITRKPMPEVASHLSVSNPTTMVSKGEIIRHHGEHCYITQHMVDLAEKVNTPEFKLDCVVQAIKDYHYALDTHQHGSVAQDRAVKAIEGILGMHWRQGIEKLAREAAV